VRSFLRRPIRQPIATTANPPQSAVPPPTRGEHEEIFAPIRRLFGMVREIATAVTHEVGAFG